VVAVKKRIERGAKRSGRELLSELKLLYYSEIAGSSQNN
jgi:hypothetical protein